MGFISQQQQTHWTASLPTGPSRFTSSLLASENVRCVGEHPAQACCARKVSKVTRACAELGDGDAHMAAKHVCILQLTRAEIVRLLTEGMRAHSTLLERLLKGSPSTLEHGLTVLVELVRHATNDSRGPDCSCGVCARTYACCGIACPSCFFCACSSAGALPSEFSCVHACACNVGAGSHLLTPKRPCTRAHTRTQEAMRALRLWS